jgi:hypothetical protein
MTGNLQILLHRIVILAADLFARLITRLDRSDLSLDIAF